MRQKSPHSTGSAEKTVRDIRRKTRRKHSTEEKIRIVLEGLRAAGVSAAVSIASFFGLLIAGTIALWAFQRQDLYMAVMFALLAYGCFQRLSQPRINS